MKKYAHTTIKVIAALAILSFAACNDDSSTNNNNNNNVSANTNLVNQNWVFASAPITPPIDFGGGSVLTDYKTMMIACQLDNIVKFMPTNTYLFSEGLLKCDPAAKDTMQGPWKFLNNETYMVVDKRLASALTGLAVPSNMYFRIAKLTADSLHLAMDTVPTFPANKVVFKFSKQ